MSGRQEHPDPTPVEWPPHLRRPESLAEQIQRLVRLEVSQAAQEQGFESFEEADDFDVDDDSDPFSEHELSDDQENADTNELRRREERAIMAARRNRGEDAPLEGEGVDDGRSSVDVETGVVDDRSGSRGVQRRPGTSAKSGGAAGSRGSGSRGDRGDQESAAEG